ncbi:MAG: uncharacterized protein KVP18_004714 [Porospora cf. gigantea A]|nr:MAG: hypothetical protein KVP18_004714 [Porospora cf. gigantea A]
MVVPLDVEKLLLDVSDRSGNRGGFCDLIKAGEGQPTVELLDLYTHHLREALAGEPASSWPDFAWLSSLVEVLQSFDKTSCTMSTKLHALKEQK